MHTRILGLLAETSLHPGSGSTTGVVDLPVAREAVTGHPVIYGSSLKGGMRARATQTWGEDDPELAKIFGDFDGVGGISVSDARLIMLPVRTLDDCTYRWLTCPYILERYRRDCKMINLAINCDDVPQVERGELLIGGEGKSKKDGVYLEEWYFKVKLAPDLLQDIADDIQQLLSEDSHKTTRERIPSQLTVCHDADFKHFAQYGLPINARNQLDENKISQNLWYEETIPPDSLFYALMRPRFGEESHLLKLDSLFENSPYLQIGGNESIGQGWCALQWLEGGGEADV